MNVQHNYKFVTGDSGHKTKLGINQECKRVWAHPGDTIAYEGNSLYSLTKFSMKAVLMTGLLTLNVGVK